MKLSKCNLLFIILIILVMGLVGCSKPNADGYVKIVSLSGKGTSESKLFTISNPDNRLVIKTTENTDPLKGQVISENGQVVASFSVENKSNEETWPFNITPGKYKIRVETIGTKYELSFEQKQTKK